MSKILTGVSTAAGRRLGRAAMWRSAVIAALVAGVFIPATAGATSGGGGRVTASGDGTKDYPCNTTTCTATFSFDVLLRGSDVSGPFSWDNGQGLTFSGTATCGSVQNGDVVFGGVVTDSFGSTYNAVFDVSDHPDGIIVGNFRPSPCDISGFGDPASAPITTGFIKITGHH